MCAEERPSAQNLINMKNTLFSILFVGSSLVLGQEIPQIQWQKALGGNSVERGNDIIQSSDGSFLAVGSASSNNGDVSQNFGSSDIWVTKLNASGEMIWEKSYGGSGGEEGQSIAETADGGFVVGGYTNSTDGDVSAPIGSLDFWIIKIDGAGNILWEKSFGGVQNDFLYDIKSTSDGGYIAIGYTLSTDGDVLQNYGGEDIWIVKLDASGNKEWTKNYGGTSWEMAYEIQEISDGNFVFAGLSASNDHDVSGNLGSVDYWIVKIDTNGDILWQKTYGGFMNDGAYSIQETSDLGFIVNGFSDSNDGDVQNNNGGTDYWILKLDNMGDILWQKSYGTQFSERGNYIIETADGNYMAVGESEMHSGGYGEKDYWILKLDSNGNQLGVKALGGSASDVARKIQQTADGGFILMGETYSNNGDVTGYHGISDYWVVKLNGTLGLEEPGSENFSFYPNPAKDQIHFSETFTQVEIYSLEGRLIKKFYGVSSVQLNDLPKGNYILKALNEKGEHLSSKLIKK